MADLQVVIRQEALEAVRGALGEAEAPARRGTALRTEGKARGTKYYAGGGGKRKAAKKTDRKATKKKAKRATRNTRRKLSPEQKAVLVERLAKARAAKRAAG